MWELHKIYEETMTRVYGCGNNDKGLWMWELHQIYEETMTRVYGCGDYIRYMKRQ